MVPLIVYCASVPGTGATLWSALRAPAESVIWVYVGCPPDVGGAPVLRSEKTIVACPPELGGSWVTVAHTGRFELELIALTRSSAVAPAASVTVGAPEPDPNVIVSEADVGLLNV